ncbi:MAG TPA: hypothetical protein PLE30_09125 [Candidatus Kapabacteria bacterium]|nr:hypothetical protein [Candidatus Kapabacteria bacterium]
MQRTLLFFIITLFIYACECVPGLDTPKEITPENSTDCIFINGVEDNESLYIETDDIKISGNISYRQSKFEYKRVKVGNYYLKIKANDSLSIIYNSPIKFRKDKKYILCAYGKDYSIETLLIEQGLSEAKWSKIINLSGELTPLQVKIVTASDTITESIDRGVALDIDIVSQKIDMIYIKNLKSELILLQKDIYLKDNNIIAIKGYNIDGNKKLTVDIMSKE